MVHGTGSPDSNLTVEEVNLILEAGTAPDLYRKKRVLVLTPDATRTCPLPMMVRAIRQVIGAQSAKLDFMVALGTHTPLPEKELLAIYGISPRQREEIFGRCEFFNHRWDQPATFARIGRLEEEEVADIFIFLLLLGNELGIDLVESARRKIEKNDKKYPVEKARGTAKKYNDL